MRPLSQPKTKLQKQAAHLCAMGDALDQHVELTDAAKLQIVKLRHGQNRENVNDTLDEFARNILLPAALVELFGENPDMKTIKEYIDSPVVHRISLLENLLDRFARLQLANGHSLQGVTDWLQQVSVSQHHTVNRFPELPYSMPDDMPKNISRERRWHALLPKPYKAENGLVLHCLTTSSDLTEESRRLGHCVGSHYTHHCCKEQSPSHIISIRDANGLSVSTLELRLFDAKERSDLYRRKWETALPGGKWILVVYQHEGKKVGGIAQYINSGPAYEAMKEFLGAVAKGKVPLQTEKKGELDSSKEHSSWAWFIDHFGCYPNWDNLNMAFQEYKSDFRRAASGTDEKGHLIYRDQVTPDGYHHRFHFIDGYTPDGLPTRHMNAREWLRASGMMELVHQLAEDLAPEIAATRKAIWAQEASAPLTATLAAPLHPLRRSFAHRINAGTLKHNEPRFLAETLLPSERESHAARLEAQRPDYFAAATRL